MSILSKTALVCAALSLALAGCASSSSDVAAVYVSPDTYSSYSCRELSMEAQRISSAAAAAAGVQDSNHAHDAAMTTVGLVVFWPALFFNKGDSVNTANLSQLKGQMQAIEAASIQKKCGISFRRS